VPDTELQEWAEGPLPVLYLVEDVGVFPNMNVIKNWSRESQVKIKIPTQLLHKAELQDGAWICNPWAS
jgi:hypothetical protein